MLTKRLIEPLSDRTHWPEVVLDFTVNAPLGKRSAGKPRKLRIKGCLEGGSGGKSKKDARMLPTKLIRMQKWKLQKLLWERGN